MSERPHWTPHFPLRPGWYWLTWRGSAAVEAARVVPVDGRLRVYRVGTALASGPCDLPPETLFAGPMEEPARHRVPYGRARDV